MNKNFDLVFSAEGGSASGGKNYKERKAPRRIFFKKILEMATRELKLKGKLSVSVNLVGEKRIQELNKKYRNKNKPTDVMSFPIQNKSNFSISQFLSFYDIGDIFICLSIAKNEAKRENITIEQKLAQLVVHGFLHLKGYEHEKSKREAEKMF